MNILDFKNKPKRFKRIIEHYLTRFYLEGYCGKWR